MDLTTLILLITEISCLIFEVTSLVLTILWPEDPPMKAEFDP